MMVMSPSMAGSDDAERAVGRNDPLILDRAFKPRRMAVVGASANRVKWANMLFRRLIKGRYKGEVVPVNPGRDQIEGIPCYTSIVDVPGDLDYVQVLVPRHDVLRVVRDCVVRRVPVVHVLSAGFGEVRGEGSALEGEIRLALQGGVTALIGPNSLGLYCARSGLDLSMGCHFEHGPTTFISQSGSLCTDVLALGQARGLKFGKVLSVGNCCDLDWPDYARYCRHDPQTGIAVFYIESVGDGRALFDELRVLARTKPVLVLKGGRTTRGDEGVVSHTGRLAGDYEIWRAMIRQAGAFELTGIEDLLLTLQADESLRRSKPLANGNDIMVIGSGGGVSILITDAAESMGLALADLSEATRASLAGIIPDSKSLGGAANPVEIPVDRMFGELQTLSQLVAVAASDSRVGSVLVHINLIAFANNFPDDAATPWTTVCKTLFQVFGQTGKALVIILRNGECDRLTKRLFDSGIQRLRQDSGLPVFGQMEPALAFLARLKEMSTH